MLMTPLSEELKLRGYSTTTPRTLVFETLQTGGAQDISEICNELKGTVDRATVYRVVQLFEELGFIRRLNFGWKYKLELSDKFTSHHHHITCRQCSKVIDIEDDKEVINYLDKLGKQTGFNGLIHELEISGICKVCQNNGTPGKLPRVHGSLTLPT